MFRPKLLTSLLMLALAVGPMSFASAPSATIADLPISLNGQQVDNATRTYPIIKRDGVLYFPLTFQDSRFMGLETKWTPKSGLEVTSAKVFNSYPKPQVSAGEKQESDPLDVQDIDYPVTFDGKSLQRAYDIFSYEGITYVPLTQELMSEVFQWSYEYSIEKGLVIEATHKGKKVTQEDEVLHMGQAQIVGEYYYYLGQMPLEDGEQGVYVAKKAIDSPEPPIKLLEIDQPWNREAMAASLEVQEFDQEVYLSLTLEENRRQAPKSHFLEVEGKLQPIISGKTKIIPYEGGIISYLLAPRFTSNLTYQPKQGEEIVLGNPNWTYNAMVLKGQWLEVSGMDTTTGEVGHMRIHMPTKTYEAFTPSDAPTYGLRLDGRQLVRKLGQKEEVLYPDMTFEKLVADGDYTLAFTTSGLGHPLDFSLLVFDSKGKEIMKVSDVLAQAHIYNDRLFFKVSDTMETYALPL